MEVNLHKGPEGEHRCDRRLVYPAADREIRPRLTFAGCKGYVYAQRWEISDSTWEELKVNSVLILGRTSHLSVGEEAKTSNKRR